MLKKKEGFTNRFEENALRESALIISEETKNMYSHYVPHRIDTNTIILINPDKDKEEQVKNYLEKLNSNRYRY